jgi:hypothetical protein
MKNENLGSQPRDNSLFLFLLQESWKKEKAS